MLVRLAKIGLFLIAAQLAAGWAAADYQSTTILLDTSSKFPDEVQYGSVFLEAYDGLGAGGGGLSAGQVRLTFTADVLPSYGDTSKFGIAGVGFNTDLVLAPKQFSGPAGWTFAADKQIGGFGFFSWAVETGKGKDATSLNPVTILVGDLGTEATLDHFLLFTTLNKGKDPGQGDVGFFARVTDFVPVGGGPSEHFIAGAPSVTDTPEPGTMVLALCGLGGLGSVRWWRRRRND